MLYEVITGFGRLVAAEYFATGGHCPARRNGSGVPGRCWLGVRAASGIQRQIFLENTVV